MLGTTFQAVAPYACKSPSNPLSDKVVKQVLERGLPAFLDSSCPKILPAKTPFFKARKGEVTELQQLLNRGDDDDDDDDGVNITAAVPREDYQYLWELVQVQLVNFYLNVKKNKTGYVAGLSCCVGQEQS